jgi:hypothetical protein
MANITPDQARRELARRELARREAQKPPEPSFNERMGASINEFADKISPQGKAMPLQHRVGATVAESLTRLAGDTVSDPLEVLIKSPLRAASRIPGNAVRDVKNLGAVAAAPFNDDTVAETGAEFVRGVGSSGLDAMEASALLPAVAGISRAGKGVSASMGRRGATQAADPISDILAASARRQGIDPSDLLARAKDQTFAGDGAMLFQRIGLDETAQALGNRAGESRNIMSQAARAQQAGQAGRVDDIMRRALGSPDDALNVDDIIRRAREQSGPLYRAAMSPDVTPDLSAVTQKPALKTYLDRAQNKLSGLGKDDATPMELLHEAQQMIGGKANRFSRAGDSYEAGLAGTLRNELMDIGKAASDDYAKATAIYRDDMQIKDAFEAGLNALGRSGDDFVRQAAGMTTQQRQAAASGMLQAIQRKLDVPESYSALRADFRKPSFRSKLGALMGDDAADNMIRQMERQADLAESANLADFARGSKTAPTQQTIDALHTDMTPGVRRAAAKGADYVADQGFAPLDLIKQATQFAGRRAGDALKSVDEDTAADLARLLVMDADEGARALAALDIPSRQRVLTIADGMRQSLITGGQGAVQGARQTAPAVPAGLLAGQQNNR